MIKSDTKLRNDNSCNYTLQIIEIEKNLTGKNLEVFLKKELDSRIEDKKKKMRKLETKLPEKLPEQPIVRLILDKNNIKDSDVLIIIDSLKKYPCIETLSLANNLITSNTISRIRREINRPLELIVNDTRVTINTETINNNLNNTNSILKKFSSFITELDLKKNLLSDEELKILTDMFSNQKFSKCIRFIPPANITDKNCPMIKMLETSIALNCFRFKIDNLKNKEDQTVIFNGFKYDDQRVNEKDAYFIYEILKNDSGVTKLNIFNARMTDGGMIYIVNLLKDNHSIQEVNISNVMHAIDESVKKLIEVIKNGTTGLKKLELNFFINNFSYGQQLSRACKDKKIETKILPYKLPNASVSLKSEVSSNLSFQRSEENKKHAQTFTKNVRKQAETLKKETNDAKFKKRAQTFSSMDKSKKPEPEQKNIINSSEGFKSPQIREAFKFFENATANNPVPAKVTQLSVKTTPGEEKEKVANNFLQIHKK